MTLRPGYTLQPLEGFSDEMEVWELNWLCFFFLKKTLFRCPFPAFRVENRCANNQYILCGTDPRLGAEPELRLTQETTVTDATQPKSYFPMIPAVPCAFIDD